MARAEQQKEEDAKKAKEEEEKKKLDEALKDLAGSSDAAK